MTMKTRYELECGDWVSPRDAQREALEYDYNADADYRREAFAGMDDPGAYWTPEDDEDDNEPDPAWLSERDAREAAQAKALEGFAGRPGDLDDGCPF